MIPRRVRLKGFLSYRDEVAYDFDGAQLWMLCGDNGAGKSSVFDAITFALYGLHRGGKTGVTDLINAQSDDLEVEFDFAVAGRDYRIRRTAARKGSPTFSAFSLDGSGESAMGEFNDETDKKDGLNTWVLNTIGLDEETFTASVMLQQGKGDKIVTSKPKDRFEMLKNIVNLSRYQQLHEKAKSSYDAKQGVVNDLQRQLTTLAPTDEGEIERLQQEIERLNGEMIVLKKEIDELEILLQNLAGWIVHSRNWEALTNRKKTLEDEIKAAQVLLDRAVDIRRAADRLSELNAVLPNLNLLHQERTDLGRELQTQLNYCEAEQEWARKLATSEDDPATLDLTTLIARLEEEFKKLNALGTILLLLRSYTGIRKDWHEAKTLEATTDAEAKRLMGEITDIQSRLATANQALEQASNRLEICSDAVRIAQLKKEAAAERLKRFHDVDSKPACDYCGLPLTPEHLDAERLRLEDAVQQTILAEQAAQTEAQKVAAEHKDAQKTKQCLADDQTKLQTALSIVQLNIVQAQKDQTKAVQSARPVLEELPDEYKRRIAGMMVPAVPDCFANTFPTEQDLLELNAQQNFLPLKEQNARELTKLKDNRRAVEVRIENHRTNVMKFVNLLPEGWQEASQAFTQGQLADWKAEAQGLLGAESELLALIDAETKQVARYGDVKTIETDLKLIPQQAQFPVDELEVAQQEAQEKHKGLNTKLGKMDQEHQQQTDRRNKILELRERYQKANYEASLHKALSDNLGRDYLQRHLLRQAESAIVAYADETLRSVSGGMLHLELREGGRDKALDILVHNLETGSKPLPVNFLSGSQKFRVAVSLALGIGQYASQGDQRIQSVIIDEGFGSLDKQARGNLIHELQALTNRLERIIVVSHQDDVAESFRDRYHIRLEGETSVAERVQMI